MDLKNKYLETADLSWRLGYEQGLKDAQMEQAQQQQMQADQMAAAQAQQPQPGQEGAAPGAEQGEQPAPGQPISQNPNGDELSQHIEKLESMLGKGELSSMSVDELKKTLSDIRSLQVQISLSKSMESIKNTKMAKSRAPIVMTPKLQANLPQPAQKALSLQQDILSGIFKKWESDASHASSEIGSILNVDGLTKKE